MTFPNIICDDDDWLTATVLVHVSSDGIHGHEFRVYHHFYTEISMKIQLWVPCEPRHFGLKLLFEFVVIHVIFGKEMFIIGAIRYIMSPKSSAVVSMHASC